MIRKNSAWRDKALRTTESAPIIDWLRDRGSLTARLQTKGSFAVRLLRQELAKPTNDEIQALGLTRTCKVRVREVALMCDGEALVFAHTALSSKPRGAMSLWFARLGTRSLGALRCEALDGVAAVADSDAHCHVLGAGAPAGLAP